MNTRIHRLVVAAAMCLAVTTLVAQNPPATPPPAEPPPPDAVFTGKNTFIDQHKLVVIRLSDHWRLRELDPTSPRLHAA